MAPAAGTSAGCSESACGFRFSARGRALHEKLRHFMEEKVYPAEKVYAQQMQDLASQGNRWKHVPAVLEDLKEEAKVRIAGFLSHPRQALIVHRVCTLYSFALLRLYYGSLRWAKMNAGSTAWTELHLLPPCRVRPSFHSQRRVCLAIGVWSMEPVSAFFGCLGQSGRTLNSRLCAACRGDGRRRMVR
eukprot:3879715-Pleurochrysis_carterae.AAC.4